MATLVLSAPVLAPGKLSTADPLRCQRCHRAGFTSLTSLTSHEKACGRHLMQGMSPHDLRVTFRITAPPAEPSLLALRGIDSSNACRCVLVKQGSSSARSEVKAAQATSGSHASYA